MKKSELKHIIKEEIVSILSEGSFEGMTPEDIKLYQDVQRLKHTGRTLDDEREAAERKKGLKLKIKDDNGMVKFFNNWMKSDAGVNFSWDEKGDEATIKFRKNAPQKSIDDFKKAVERSTKVELIEEVEMSSLDKVNAEIAKHLEMYKDAEGDTAKKSAVEMLKKLNVEKKRLEAEKEEASEKEMEAALNIGRDQELDYDSED